LCLLGRRRRRRLLLGRCHGFGRLHARRHHSGGDRGRRWITRCRCGSRFLACGNRCDQRRQQCKQVRTITTQHPLLRRKQPTRLPGSWQKETMSPSSDRSGHTTPSGLSQRRAAAKAENSVRQFLTPYDFSRGPNTGRHPCATACTDLSPRVVGTHRFSVKAWCKRTTVVRTETSGTPSSTSTPSFFT